jgi:GNAT superfamily N-acetyltransferase
VSNQISIAEIQQSPSRIAATVDHPTLGQVTFRPLMPGDAEILGRYFLGLSEETRRLYGPHPFDRATADRLCAQIDYAHTIRMLATVGTGSQGLEEQVIAYFILRLGVSESEKERYRQAGIVLDFQTDCSLAPSVADAYQDQGVGSLLIDHLFSTARRLGYERMVLVGGVRGTNDRAIHFYRKHGFDTIGTFEHPDEPVNYDMIVEL